MSIVENIPEQIITLLKAQTGLDFASYKPNTLIRRVNKRFTMSGLNSLEEYYELLQNSPQETEALKNDILIGVTSFFRDTDVFSFLKSKVIPGLLNTNELIRIWVAGCSTGEEAYSLAILLNNYIRRHDLNTDFKIFATDVSSFSVNYASRGCFSELALERVSQKDRKYYFNISTEGYCVKKFLREKIVFAQHNLISDPPFINIHLVSCRNLLIYLQSSTQEKVLENFIFSLKTKGYLLLGKSENLGSLKPFFKVIDSKWKLFQIVKKKKRLSSYNKINPQNTAGFSEKSYTYFNPLFKSTSMNEFSVQKILENLLPPMILLDQADNIIYIKGDISKYLKVDQGIFQPNLIKMLKKESAIILKRAISEVKSTKVPVTIKKLRIDSSEGIYEVKLKIFYIDSEEAYPNIAVLFMNENPLKKDTRILELPKLDKISEQRIQDLENELEDFEKENLKLKQELDYIKEKMQTSNEELLASNEELQATNEELQSVNEELNSLNNEYSEKNAMLIKLNDDMMNLLDSTEIATIFLDINLKIRNFTPKVQDLFNVQTNDVGRPFNSFSSKFNNNIMDEIIKHSYLVLKNAETIEKEVEDSSGCTYIRRIGPFKTSGNLIEGVVITFVDITHTKESQRRIKESEEKYKKLISTMPSSFTLHRIITDSNGKPVDSIFMEANEEFEKISGLKTKDIIGKPLTKVWPDRYKKWIDIFDEIITYRGPIRKIVFSDLKNKYFEISGYLVQEGYIVLITIDVTKRYLDEEIIKEKNKKLTETKERYNLATKASNIGIWDWHIKEDRIYYSSIWKAQLGYKGNELANKFETWNKLLHPDDKEQTNNALNSYINNPTDFFEIEFRLKHKNGNYVWIFSKAASILDDNGKVIRIFGSHTDITAQKYAKEELNKITQRFRLATLSADIGIWELDLETNTLHWDDQMYKIYGVQKNKFSNHFEGWQKALHPNDRDKAMKEFKLALQGVKDYKDQFHILHPDKSVHCIHSQAIIIKKPNGNPYKMIGVNWDITAEEEIKNELIRAKEQAEIANIHKNNFLANMSHEIRTPMNGIIGFSELLKEDDITPKQKDLYLQIINNNSQSLLSLIDDIIDISKIEANEIKIFKEPVDISELFYQLKTEYDRLKTTLNKKQIEILIDRDSELNHKLIRTDKLRLRQILVNLLNNAIKFTEKGKITFGYKINNKKIEFFVKDEGIGIPVAKASEIFERFYRLDSKAHRKYRGTGLGLAISKGLTDLLGGNIWVDTDYKDGASVHFTIPYKECLGLNLLSESELKEDGDATLNGVNILLVEDEENIVTFFKEALKSSGVEIMWADNGESAIEKYKKNAKHINAILMDINLPGMDGINTTQNIMRYDPSATIIAQTAYAMPEEIEKCLKAGCVDYLTKPIKPQLLISKLKKYC
ncbi:CheR family methyltransferase [Saccharicrinis sp. FJH2]|uniref:CheR family methyltransferase n=1 Tax=Saccharicrinis sp. FJH65 TaxID=3344659 RepID=UPI0035F3283B